jgi:hypothetical protein
MVPGEFGDEGVHGNADRPGCAPNTRRVPGRPPSPAPPGRTRRIRRARRRTPAAPG